MKANHFRNLAIVAGIVSVIVSLLYGNAATVYFKPWVHVFLMAYYAMATRKLNVLLLLAFGSVMLGETFIALDFMENYGLVITFFSVFFIFNCILLWPVLRKMKIRFLKTDSIGFLLGAFGLIYVLFSVYLMTVEKIPQAWSYVMVIFAFFAFISCCFLIRIFNKHPNNILLFVVGFAYVFVCVGAMVYELLYKEIGILGIVNACEVLAQVLFVTYLLNIDRVVNDEKGLL